MVRVAIRDLSTTRGQKAHDGAGVVEDGPEPFLAQIFDRQSRRLCRAGNLPSPC
jgi:hypothetical protein